MKKSPVPTKRKPLVPVNKKALVLWGCAVLFLSLWLTMETAQADPSALRTPIQGRSLNLVGAIPFAHSRTNFSAGSWLTDTFGLAAQLSLSINADLAAISAVGISAGTRWHLAGKPVGWGIKAFVHGGLLFPTVAPGFGLTLTPALQGGYYGPLFRASLGLVVPLSVSFVQELAIRIPTELELWLAWQVKRFLFGVRLNTGAIFIPGQDPAATLQFAITLALTL